MKKSLILIAIQLLFITKFVFAGQPHYISLLKEMFIKVAVEKNVGAIPLYYREDFKLYSNGKEINYDEFLKQHQKIYTTPIQYKFRYDEETFIENENKIAGRLFITTKKPNESAQEIEVILVAEYKNNKLFRLWELTYPDWSKMKAFQRISS